MQEHLEVTVAYGGVGGKGTVWRAGAWCAFLDSLPPSRAVAVVPSAAVPPSLSLLSWLYAQGVRDSQWGIGLCHKEPSVPTHPGLWNSCADFPDTLAVKSH